MSTGGCSVCCQGDAAERGASRLRATYKCPRCQASYCSAACCRRHRCEGSTTACTDAEGGERDRLGQGDASVDHGSGHCCETGDASIGLGVPFFRQIDRERLQVLAHERPLAADVDADVAQLYERLERALSAESHTVRHILSPTGAERETQRRQRLAETCAHSRAFAAFTDDLLAFLRYRSAYEEERTRRWPQ
ncbi:hypothetical protein CDCA_CDCA13G3599 [Cyanidium caldarium]|uniref:HIT-type domain-containing protein n=1 Tax=Cyanidium caldarium TaxID=2771 RepID=A0AAV9IZS2_CYACA|nr:hypothetical protein CDCA_CDCA13G3599 [Cyanidium caldarium]